MSNDMDKQFQRLREFAWANPITRANGVLTEHYMTLPHVGVKLALSLNK